MSGFAHPLQLLWLIPATVLVLWFGFGQMRALRWLETQVAERFLVRLTRHSRASLRVHIALLGLGLAALLLALAGPFRLGEVQSKRVARTVVILLDASLSMGAPDAGGQGEEKHSRFDQAKRFALGLVEALPQARFALVSFSSVPVIHSPPTDDHFALRTILSTLNYHLFAEEGGTHFSTAFDTAARLTEKVDEALDVVLISDGELPEPDAYEQSLSLLQARGVAVHSVGVGGTEPISMRAFDLEDVVLGKPNEERRVAARYETRREDEALERIARENRGAFLVLENGDDVSVLLDALSSAIGSREISDLGRIDLARYAVGAFLLLFLVETLLLADRSRGLRFDGRKRTSVASWPENSARAPRARKATGAAALAVTPFLVLAECPGPVGEAWRVLGSYTLNELGREHLAQDDRLRASLLFQHAVSLGYRQHISLFNLGTTKLSEGSLSTGGEDELEALKQSHRHFERALRQRPRYRPALFNDGHALGQWGQKELDLEACELERTKVLWTQALERFTRASRGWGSLASEARDNRRGMEARLRELEQWRERCESSESPPPSEPPPGGGGGGEGEGEDEGKGEGGGEGQSQDESQEQGEPPSGAGGADSPPPPLSGQDRDQIAAELERIRGEASGASGFHHSGASQITPGKAKEASGKKVWW